MKSAKIIYLLFLILSINCLSKSYAKTPRDLHEDFIKSDSVFSYQAKIFLSESDAKAIIANSQIAPSNGEDFTTYDLEKIAIGYAILNDAARSSEYLERYIKKEYDINILENIAFNRIKNSKEYISVSNKYKPNFSFLNLFYFYIGLVGIFIAVILNFRKESDKVANILVSLFILLSSFFIIHIFLFISNVQFEFPHSLFGTITFNFLYGPLLYFYFKRIIERYTFKLVDSLHLIPSILLLIYFFKYYLLSGDDKLNLLINRNENFDPILTYVVIFKVISLIVYGVLVYRIFLKAKGRNLKGHSFILNWQRNMVFLNSAYVFSHILYVLMITGIIAMNFLIHPQIISMSLLILYVGYSAYVQPKVFDKKYYFKGILDYKYQNSALSETYSKELKEELLKLFYDEKIFIENNISLDILSEKLGTTRHNTSQVINEHFNMNYFNLINKLRIEEAQQIFKNNYHNNINVIDVAYDVGFNNKVTFNKAFKEQTKLTPTNYINNLHTNHLKDLSINLR